MANCGMALSVGECQHDVTNERLYNYFIMKVLWLPARIIWPVCAHLLANHNCYTQRAEEWRAAAATHPLFVQNTLPLESIVTFGITQSSYRTTNFDLAYDRDHVITLSPCS